MKTELTQGEKLQALALRFYSGYPWEPKKGDYYTTSRADLELYQIIDEDEHNFYTVYCDEGKQFGNPPAFWPKESFLKDFGERRVYVPDFVLNPQTTN